MNTDTDQSAVPSPGAPDDPQADAPLLKTWRENIRRAKRCDRDAFKAIAEQRRYYAGRIKRDEVTLDDADQPGEEYVRANLIYSTMAALFPRIYARNPEIAVSPSDAVQASTHEAVRDFSRTLEIVVNSQIREAGVKREGKRCVRSAMTTKIGWAKVSYQRDYATDPQIGNRINDAQDNLARVRALVAECRDAGVDAAEHEEKQAELEDQLAALEQQPEVVVAEGLVIDRILPDDMLVDPGIREMVDCGQAGWIAHGCWMDEGEACARFKFGAEDLKGATRYHNRNPIEHDEDGAQPSASSTAMEPGKQRGLLRVWEIWDRDAGVVRTWVEGMRRWAREPFVPTRQGRRWFPFFPLILNPLDGERWPLSDIDLLRKLQDEYNDTREKFAEHRDKVKPGTAFRKNALTEDDVRKLNSRDVGEMVGLDGPDDQDRPLANEIAEIATARIDPALYDTTYIRGDFDAVSGTSDAARGAVIKAKTATEAEYLEQGLGERTEERRDTIEDWITEIARFAAEVLLQELTPPQVQRIAGAGAVWPTMAREEIYSLVQIEVRAGSTGKPNRAKEREAWRELLPLLLQAQEKIAAMRMQGMDTVADAHVELLRETLRRLDERLDVEKFLPLAPMQPAMPQQGMPAPAAGTPAPPVDPGFAPAPMGLAEQFAAGAPATNPAAIQ